MLARLEEEYRAAGNGVLFEHLNELLADESDAPSQADIAKKLGMTENAVKQAFYRLRALPGIITRGDRAHRRSAWRCRKRAPAFHFCSANVTWAQFSDSTS